MEDVQLKYELEVPEGHRAPPGTTRLPIYVISAAETAATAASCWAWDDTHAGARLNSFVHMAMQSRDPVALRVLSWYAEVDVVSSKNNKAMYIHIAQRRLISCGPKSARVTTHTATSLRTHAKEAPQPRAEPPATLMPWQHR